MSAIPVLMYHSISDDGQKLSVSKHNFYKQAKIMLKLGFKSVNLKDIFNDKSKKKFVITFDDGYQDVFTNAYPIIKELNFDYLMCITSYDLFPENKLGLAYNFYSTKNRKYLEGIVNGISVFKTR